MKGVKLKMMPIEDIVYITYLKQMSLLCLFCVCSNTMTVPHVPMHRNLNTFGLHLPNSISYTILVVPAQPPNVGILGPRRVTELGS